jgi:uncharacterized membrane protein
MTAYDAIRYVHILAGSIALASFWTAATLRKGSSGHGIVGRTFLISMGVISISGLFIALAEFGRDRPVFASFLLYLVLIVVTPCWLGWRAMRDKRDVKRYTGPIYHTLAWLNLAAGAIMLMLGIVYEQLIIAAVSGVGLATGTLMLRFARQGTTDRQWWLRRHYTFMIGAGVGAHVAFLNLGLPRLLPAEWGIVAQRLSWFLPFVMFLIARTWLDRKYAPRRAAQPADARYGDEGAGASS